MASESLGELGPMESQPALVQWQWYYNVPALALWGLIFLLLVVPKANRCRQAWLILIPLGLVLLVWQMPVRLIGTRSESAERFGFLVVSGAMAWSVVWLLGHWVGTGSRVLTFSLALAVMLVMGTVSHVSHFGIEDSGDLAPLLISYGLCVLFLLLAMMLASFSCRHDYYPARFLRWLAVWLGAVLVALGLVWTVLALSLGPKPRPEDVVQILAIMAVVPAVLGGTLYLINLPFLILAFKSPFYRERFLKTFCLEKSASLGGETEAPFDDVPFSAEPTAKPVAVEDVVGRWQFYLDSASRTVIVEFRSDGTFAQTWVANQGGQRECPGGTWRIEGPMVHLAGYVTAAQGAGRPLTWWMIDTPSGLALFGGDGPDADSFFRLRRLRQADG